SLEVNDEYTSNFRDCLFDKTVLGQDSDFDTSFNAYVNGYSRWTPTNAHDVILTNSPAYEGGAFGRWYVPTNSPLLQHGSRPADQAQLFWYTATANPQTIASNLTVSIGHHYPTVD